MDKLPPKAFRHICKICLIYGDLIQIDAFEWEGVKLKEIVEYLTIKLNLMSADSLPSQMCKICIKAAYKTNQFLMKYEKSHRLFLKILAEESDTCEVKAENFACNVSPKDEFSENDEMKANLNENNSLTNEDLLDVDDPSDSIGFDNADNDSNHSNSEEAVDTNLVGKIDCVKKQINKIHSKNKIRFQNRRQANKAQLIDYKNLPKSKKRAYVFKKGPPYTCITCDSSYQNYEELKRHKVETNHKKSLRYRCEHCDKRLDTYCKYVEHTRTHTGEKPNKCTTCGKCFNFKTDLKRHTVMHMDVKPYICRFCSRGFSRRQYLRDHERKHTGEQLICSYCGKGFHSYSTLSYHEKRHKGPPDCVRDPLSSDRLFRCHLCDKTLLTEFTLKTHILLHGPRNFSCEICGRTYITKCRLQEHIKLTHRDSKFICNICKKEYSQKTSLEAHLKSHSGENRYPCDICGKQFACKGSLYQHNRIHTGDTKYQCKECLQVCLNRRNLENHMRIHTGEKPFSCFYCGKCFAQKANMQAHMKIHTGVRNHLCKLCDKAFYDSRGLKKHMLVHEKKTETLT